MRRPTIMTMTQHCRRDAKREATPERDVTNIGDTELLDVEGKERHHHREPGEADKRGSRDRDFDFVARSPRR